jgi:hypothetical protein
MPDIKRREFISLLGGAAIVIANVANPQAELEMSQVQAAAPIR